MVTIPETGEVACRNKEVTARAKLLGLHPRYGKGILLRGAKLRRTVQTCTNRDKWWDIVLPRWTRGKKMLSELCDEIVSWI